MLIKIPSLDEIKFALFSLEVGSSLGPDDFLARFFQFHWDIIHSDVCKVIFNFFRSGIILQGINSIFLSLIPKIPDAIDLSDYRPIVLGNTLYKIITHILASRLTLIADRILSPN